MDFFGALYMEHKHKTSKVYAFIDSQNLTRGMLTLSWYYMHPLNVLMNMIKQLSSLVTVILAAS